ncbi:3-hydroxyacyl-CoA dehydrogenase NAD-binding domain-containing protein [Streptomyces mirabilis]|uniref:3-hydroxyacyl-CoA dehydrogenase NAD-binding domain-containing protein n=1 Tax=Streptomyces mirabilis TaxID=68239 RepID=UPI00332A105A
MSRDIRRVGVVGGGQMGAGIAEVCARAGLDTVVCEVDAVAARDRVAASSDRAVERGKLTRTAARDALDRTVFSGSLEDLADRQLVVEAVVENADAKTEIFTALDKIVEAPDAVLASNTSSLPVMRLGRATHRADRFLGLHFFNPVPVLPLVEVVASLHTAPEAVGAVEDFGTRTLGKTVIRSSLYDEFKEPLYAPPPPLQRMVEAGLLGRKTGRGFHVYGQE